MLRYFPKQGSTLLQVLSLRFASTDASPLITDSQLPLTLPIIGIWGANTGVGKTLFSAGLAAACTRAGIPLCYIKPVQTGFPEDSDARLVAAAAGLASRHGPHAAALLPSRGDDMARPEQDNLPRNSAISLFAWKQAVSPHLAVQNEGRAVSDDELTAAIFQHLNAFALLTQTPSNSSSRAQQSMCLVETAGGVASPGPNGNLQCDMLRTLRLPALLIGDGRLGGISATLSAYDSLMLRGYSVPAIALMDPSGLSNSAAIARHVGADTQVLTFPACLPRSDDTTVVEGEDGIDAQLASWLKQTEPQFDALRQVLESHHADRVQYLLSAASGARKALWWPFTQHAAINEGDVTVIDARVGEKFIVLKPGSISSEDRESRSNISSSMALVAPIQSSIVSYDGLQQWYDGCASWWTQGVDQYQQSTLTRAAAYAAARYGHIMYPQNVHQPALDLAHKLLDTVGTGWASRVFYSDDGSTAIEVALKMAFRKYMVDHSLLDSSSSTNTNTELHVLGLQEAYHGDTLGAMDAVAPSPFNGRLQTPWYQGRGLFLNPPLVSISSGQWRVLPWTDGAFSVGTNKNTSGGSGVEFSSAAEASSDDRLNSPLALTYHQHIEEAITNHLAAHPSAALGACIIEPVLQGAGGMRFIDPLYQRLLVQGCKARKIPVIYDEVFSGLWRLGVPAAGGLLGETPDIGCYAKLLTGGLIPLSATLATEDVFNAFQGDTKAQALLHGHSYTAHPIGCAVACAALDLYSNPATNANLCAPVGLTTETDAGGQGGKCRGGNTCSTSCRKLLPLWDEDRAKSLSLLPGIKRVLVLGTVLAVEVSSDTTGYTSSGAVNVVKKLREAGVYSRPLGNVVYLMVTPLTSREQCIQLMDILEQALNSN